MPIPALSPAVLGGRFTGPANSVFTNFTSCDQTLYMQSNADLLLNSTATKFAGVERRLQALQTQLLPALSTKLCFDECLAEYCRF